MISKETMMLPILQVADGFKPIWKEFLDDWSDENELPVYLALSDLARYVSTLVENSDEEELRDIFSVVERWHLEGDEFVKEAATVGLLEDLQNTAVVGDGMPQKIEPFLLPQTRLWWHKVSLFWSEGRVISE
ncbi:DUF7674 family protein [Alteromonas ponticola]|uniref:DUF7674 domain-containing protein n=1 Tax=Alteromonas ponticola TaxID=2720613 RepID=A0ABX1R0U0_9ALTE|nr:hypothetical protein [Alteromonas ponticola]NMH58702.1 hypothetical protein [Alteromonas ponticola]